MARMVAILTAVVLTLTGCGGHDHGAMTEGGRSDNEAAGHQDTSAFGMSGNPEAADTTIEIEATDALAFDPDSIEIDEGETVTFVVTNSGELPHEFVLGDAEYQSSHEDHMSGDGHAANAVSVAPGATAEITWTFTEAGRFEFACHVDGHYPGGMRGTIRVS